MEDCNYKVEKWKRKVFEKDKIIQAQGLELVNLTAERNALAERVTRYEAFVAAWRDAKVAYDEFGFGFRDDGIDAALAALDAGTEGE